MVWIVCWLRGHRFVPESSYREDDELVVTDVCRCGKRCTRRLGLFR